MVAPNIDPQPRHVAVLKNGLGQGAADIAAALRAGGHDVTEIEAEGNFARALADLRPDVVFNAVAGPFGRSGKVQGLLELLGIPYTHSGVLASALAADRHQAKIVLRAAGLPVTDHLIVHRADAARAHQMTPPYVVKALHVGTPDAAILVGGPRELPPAQLLEPDWSGGEDVMVERYVPGRTLAVAVMGAVALSVSEVVPREPGEKSAEHRNQLVTPAQISPNIYEKTQKMSLKAHEVLGCRGVTRTSFRFNDLASGDSGLVCLEIDTQPDLSPKALVPDQALNAGHSFADLVAWMVEDASCNR